mmetsp:Transcript_14577/g.46517  ORF Transcript_14577/g.46517 Transcript_14577/m.46517 type:complete len:236 (-) Transcript_14577:145-852(-)
MNVPRPRWVRQVSALDRHRQCQGFLHRVGEELVPQCSVGHRDIQGAPIAPLMGRRHLARSAELGDDPEVFLQISRQDELHHSGTKGMLRLGSHHHRPVTISGPQESKRGVAVMHLQRVAITIPHRQRCSGRGQEGSVQAWVGNVVRRTCHQQRQSVEFIDCTRQTGPAEEVVHPLEDIGSVHRVVIWVVDVGCIDELHELVHPSPFPITPQDRRAEAIPRVREHFPRKCPQRAAS